MRATIYTLPNCPACTRTKQFMVKRGFELEVIDLAENPDLLEQFRAEGLQSAPVVETGGQRWAGLRPDLIAQAAA
ncbi:glutaredoxin family protein [Pseudoclavibacter alba]|uniref:glutaredoxin domain-containing protein n=1 Tax=Pseudoclavibacter albus TaxID=272241 RepID=UPI0019D25373|nr:glutaredoxin domain-containing protein [Pseudoclavibacter alba]MBN6778839.1 glutaredoxin family protein [Pseudoclavibacter alba]